MKTYFSFFRVRFNTLIQYRTAAFAGIMTQWLFGLVRILALYAFYRSSDAVQPMSFAQVVAYTWVGQAMLGMLPWNIEPEIAQSVRTGQVAYELTRPLDLYSMWYARCVAYRLAPTLLKSVPQFLIATLLIPEPFGMSMPELPVFLAWLTTIIGSLLLSAAITSLFNISLLWTVSGEGIVLIVPSLVTLFSGMTVPLPLLPDWMQLFLRWQPCAALVDLPNQLFCGSLPLSELPAILATQLGWTIILVLIGRALMKRGLKQVSVAGG